MTVDMHTTMTRANDCSNRELGRQTDSHQWQSFTSSLMAGVAAKVCVNNANRTVARYQVTGSKQLDLSMKSARGQLFGASLQSLGVFKGRELLGAGQRTPESASELATEFAKNFAAGVAGGLMMHPCCIPFFFIPAEKHKTGLFPSANAFKKVVAADPALLVRGTMPRAMSTGIEFGIYFTSKSALKDHIENPIELEAASSLPAIPPAVFFHQMYIDAMNNKKAQGEKKASTIESVAKLASKGAVEQLFTRHRISFALFTLINMTELAILDLSKKKFSSGADQH